ncbi:MAG TPA: hypothetical protein VFL83_04630 [Anaeromyxobacter sp.]|nr:hypothetical protein [Anaeromyxobacter sp.]
MRSYSTKSRDEAAEKRWRELEAAWRSRRDARLAPTEYAALLSVTSVADAAVVAARKHRAVREGLAKAAGAFDAETIGHPNLARVAVAAVGPSAAFAAWRHASEATDADGKRFLEWVFLEGFMGALGPRRFARELRRSWRLLEPDERERAFGVLHSQGRVTSEYARRLGRDASALLLRFDAELEETRGRERGEPFDRRSPVAVGVPLPAPSGRTSIPVYELDRKRVARPSARIRPFDFAKGFVPASVGQRYDLEVSAWRLFHAAAKVDLARSFTADETRRRAVALAELYRGLLAWGPQLRLSPGGAASYRDFYRSDAAGRLAEALAHLLMHDRFGYVYWDHLASLLRGRASIHPEQIRRKFRGRPRPGPEPDFVFEDAAGQVALAESKGGFVTRGGSPPAIATQLRTALKQLAGWDGAFEPPARKAFAIGAFLRELDDPDPEPSLVAFVDPPAREPPERQRRSPPPDWVRRGNYGSWLVGMGHRAAGASLRAGVSFPEREAWFRLLRVAGRQFAVAATGILTSPTGSRFGAAVHVRGLELGIMRRVARALTSGADETLAAATPLPVSRDLERTSDVPFEGSLLADGTLEGTVDPKALAELEPVRVVLGGAGEPGAQPQPA